MTSSSLATFAHWPLSTLLLLRCPLHKWRRSTVTVSCCSRRFVLNVGEYDALGDYVSAGDPHALITFAALTDSRCCPLSAPSNCGARRRPSIIASEESSEVFNLSYRRVRRGRLPGERGGTAFQDEASCCLLLVRLPRRRCGAVPYSAA